MKCPLCKSDILIYPIHDFNGKFKEWCGLCDGNRDNEHSIKIYSKNKEDILRIWEQLECNDNYRLVA